MDKIETLSPGENVATLHEHSAPLHEHSAPPHEHSATPHEHSATLHEHSATPHEHSAALHEHSATPHEHVAPVASVVGALAQPHGRFKARPAVSLIGWSAGRRLAWAAGAVAGLWLAVAWALDWFSGPS